MNFFFFFNTRFACQYNVSLVTAKQLCQYTVPLLEAETTAKVNKSYRTAFLQNVFAVSHGDPGNGEMGHRCISTYNSVSNQDLLEFSAE